MNLSQFAGIVGKLKLLKRAGWVKRRVQDPESVAEHSYRLALLAMYCARDYRVDEAKVVKMALLHDLGEATIGDVVTYHGVQELPHRSAKLAAEREALLEILTVAGASEDIALFDEFQANKTKEARLVQQLDKLEMAIQAAEYEREHGLDLEELYVTAEAFIDDPSLKRLVQELWRERHSDR
jgi:putative hydrolase of HD superfamily